MSVRSFALALQIWCAAAIAFAQPLVPEKSPVSPDDSLRHFQLPDDLEIQLVAAEPEIVDPIDMRVDELGRMYVVEMRDYPNGPKTPGTPSSRIKLLVDADGDGRFETAHVFADGLSFATGVQPWKGGVIVTLAGRVAWMKDTDGDFKADVDETWFTGFAEENSQLRANHPRFAHDNHIYIANGLRGGKILDMRVKDAKPIDISGRDFRFDPRGGGTEAVTGVGQYGLCFDDYGHRFVCMNRNPLQHVVFENRDLAKNKNYAPPAVMNDVAASGEKSKLFPLTKTWTTSNLHENQFTAACGVNIYRGDALPKQYHGLAFTCDPTANIVHAERMTPAGPTFTSQPLYEDREFLASTDPWFRPVAIENGPDGALYVVDMYRAVIEHPDWVPDELKKRPDERWGDDRGRIYRIVSKDKKARRSFEFPLNADGTPNSLYPAISLLHRNAWNRETTQRLLVQQPSPNEEEANALATRPQGVRGPQAFQSLWTLRALGWLKPEHLQRAVSTNQDFRDSIAVLANELEIASDATRNQIAEFRRNLLASGAETESYAKAFLQLAPLTSDEITRAALWTASRENDAWSRSCLLLSVNSDALGVWKQVVTPGVATKTDTLQRRELSRELIKLAATQKDVPHEQILLQIQRAQNSENESLILSAVQGLAEAMRRENLQLSDLKTSSDAQEFLELLSSTIIIEFKANANTNQRLRLIEILTAIDAPNGRKVIQEVTHSPDQTLRIAAIKAVLSKSEDDEVQDLLARLRSESPAAKRAIVEGMLNKKQSVMLLLDSIESGKLATTDIDVALTPRLVTHGDLAIRERAIKLLSPPIDENRKQTHETYKAALKQIADSAAGRKTFEKTCAQCHKIGELGVNVAPDISDSRTKTAEQILLDVLEPNRAVDGNFLGYVVALKDGRVLSGVIAAESDTAITLKQPGGQSVVVVRADIDELVSTGKSLMPERLDANIPPGEMANLISFIKNWRYLDGRVPAK